MVELCILQKHCVIYHDYFYMLSGKNSHIFGIFARTVA